MTENDNRFEAFGFKVPLPSWATALLAAVVVLGSAGLVYQKVVSDPDRIVTNLKSVNDAMAFEVGEYGRHVMEDPTRHEELEDADGFLGIRVYSDHCVLIQRRTRDGVLTKLVPDLARQAVRRTTGWPEPMVKELVVSASGRCLNPHPGQFNWKYGEKRGDWIQVWWFWPDGCQHYQMMHVPTGTWATNQDGTPAINWVACNH